MSHSEKQLRRSERLKEKDNAIASKAKTEFSLEGVQKRLSTKSVKSQHTRSSVRSVKSRREQVRIEMEMKRQDLLHQHQQAMLELEASMKIAKLDEEEEYMSSVSSSEGKPEIEDWIDGKCPWIKKGNVGSTQSLGLGKPKVGDFITNNEQIASSQLTKILTRQSVPKDLPYFSGNPMEWPNFIYQYENTTAICGYSKEENQCRLQRCLKGHARKIVESSLILPQNVDRVIETLRNRFGRPEYIITLLLDKIKKFPFVKEDKLELLIDYSDEVKNIVCTIEILNEIDHLRNPMLLQELLNKLSANKRLEWVEYISSKILEKPKLVEFSIWLENKASAACQIQMPKSIDIKDDDKPRFKGYNKRDVTLTAGNSESNIRKCFCCEGVLHPLYNCSKFKCMTTDEKWKFVISKKACFCCLMPSHNLKSCKRRKTCSINNCPKFHHQLLHKDVLENTETNEINTREVNCHISAKRNVLLKILPVVLCNNQKSIHCYALLDDASTVTLIDEDLANELDLRGPQNTLSITWTNNQVENQSSSRIVTCCIRKPDDDKKFLLRHIRTMKGMDLPEQTVDMEEIRKKYPYLNQNIPSIINAKPRILIGQDNCPLLINRKFITGPWNSPTASKTLLGWVVHGNVCFETRSTLSENFVCHIGYEEKDDLDVLHDLVKKQWQIDNLGLETSNKCMSKEDKRAQEIMDKTMRRIGDRFETGLLWKYENIVFPESKSTAMKRLFITERKMDRDSQYATLYCDKMKDLEQKGYIRKLPQDIKYTENSNAWYLPHFGVCNPNKPNKIRIVFDAASRSNGVSLNDFLLTGPDLYKSLYKILTNFRIKNYAFTADIKEMFLQVCVREEDRHCQRFLWRQMERNIDPEIYEIMVVFFGSTSGPCLAQEAKNKNAREFIHQLPEAAKAIIEDHYMDDYLGNADTKEEAKSLIQNVVKLHAKGGFTICNWISNCKEILSDLDPSLLASSAKNISDGSENTSERILGVWWNPEEDIFQFQTKFYKINKDILDNRKLPTKREILKVVMSTFDPLGFLTHFLVQCKLLLQEIWRNKLDWDEVIPEYLYEKWTLWLNDLKKIFTFKIPRQYFSLDKSCSNIQLHLFSDASINCYATVDFRVQHEDNIQTAFITAKTRVAPLKPLSIPRLELLGALMGARLGYYLKNNLSVKISNVFYWTDSKTVLYWIHSEAHRYKVFVAQRLGEIQDITNVTEWNYVPSKENVADEATKRKKPLDFSQDSTWLFGPTFLREKMENWPKQDEILEGKQDDTLERRRNQHVLLNYERKELLLPDPQRFSKWNRLRRATAWILRFIENCKKNIKIGELDTGEISQAEKLLYKKCQLDSFHKEIRQLELNKPIDRSSRLYTLSSELDQDGLLRLGGRLNNSTLVNIETKKPIILDSKHSITKLLIQHYHEELWHQGQETLISKLREKFWILRIRQAVKTLKINCQTCKNNRAVPEVPIMGQLPTHRLEPTIRCFIKTGVDYFGPINVTVRRSTEKRYGVIFTCMVTRAIHLEIAQDLSTNAFIHILRQFGSRRGFPEEIYSDNGTNFKGAEKELSIAVKNLNQGQIKTFCTLKNIKWFFNPPAAPHMGGAWERLIQSVKKVMKEMLISRHPQEYVLRTVFLEAENIINSRPLTHVSIDPEDLEPITPNHFLIGPEYKALPCTMTEEVNLNLLSKWKASQKLVDYFWKRWTQEYMPFLVQITDPFKKMT